MKRIALLVHSSNWSGYENGIYELLIRWNRSPTPIVYMTEEGILGKKLRGSGIAVRILPMDGCKRRSLHAPTPTHNRANMGMLGMLKYAAKLSQSFKLDKIECVHASTNTIVYGTIAAKLTRLPIIWNAQKNLDAPYLNPTIVTIFRWGIRYIPDGIVVNSLSTLTSLKLPTRKLNRVQVIFPSYSGEYGRLSGVGPDLAYTTVLLVGRLAEWKGQHLLLSAAKAFLPERSVRFWLVGAEQYEEPVYRDLLKYQIRSNGLTNITLFGHMDDLKSVIHQADILLHTNMAPEPLNQVILQAMAAGIPVIASNIGGPRDVIRDGETGMLFPPGDIGALRRAIRWMINHPEERVEMGLKGMERIKNHFAVDMSLQRIMDYYQ